MRARWSLIGLAVAVTALPTRAHAFEGVLHMLMTMPQVATVKTDVSIRNGDSRTDTFIPFMNQKVSFIQRGSSPTIQIVHSTKQYSESSFLSGKATGDVAARLQGATVRDLGVEMVAGYACKHALITSSAGANVEVWVTSAISASGGSMSLIGDGDALMATLKRNGLDGFPLKVTMVEMGLPITLEAISVEAKSVDPSLFSIPAGYARVKETDMGLRALTPDEQETLSKFEKQLMAPE